MKDKKLVVKVGTSTLTYESGRLNLRRMEQLCKVLCNLQNAGYDVVLVSSGAIGVGIGYQYRNLFHVKNLYMNFDIPIRAYLDQIKEAKLGSSTLHERTWSGNGWLFIGYQF